MRFILFIVLCLISFSIVANQIYKWTDKHGNVHYSEHKPKGEASQKLQIDPPKNQRKRIVNTIKSEESSSSTQEKLDYYRLKDQEARQRKKILHQKCKQAKENLSFYSQKMTFKIKDNRTGGFRYLTDEQKSNLIRRYQKHVDKYKRATRKYCGR